MRVADLLDRAGNLLLGHARIDHNPMYMCVMFWDLFAGAYAVAVGLPDSAMTHMSHYSTRLICWLMFGGGLACCAGITMGTRASVGYWLRRLRGIEHTIDLRLPYILGVCGTPMLVVSFFFYSIAIFGQMPWDSTMASEASLALAVGTGALLNFGRFSLEIRKIGTRLPLLIEQELDMQVLEASGDELE